MMWFAFIDVTFILRMEGLISSRFSHVIAENLMIFTRWILLFEAGMVFENVVEGPAEKEYLKQRKIENKCRRIDLSNWAGPEMAWQDLYKNNLNQVYIWTLGNILLGVKKMKPARQEKKENLVPNKANDISAALFKLGI